VWGEKRNGEKDKRGRFNENRRKKRKTATPKRLKHQKIPNHCLQGLHERVGQEEAEVGVLHAEGGVDVQVGQVGGCDGEAVGP